MLAYQKIYNSEVVGVLSIEQSTGKRGVLILPWFNNRATWSNPSKGYHGTFYDDHEGNMYTPLAIIHTHSENDMNPSFEDNKAASETYKIPMFILGDLQYRQFYPNSSVGDTYDLTKPNNPTSLGPK